MNMTQHVFHSALTHVLSCVYGILYNSNLNTSVAKMWYIAVQ